MALPYLHSGTFLLSGGIVSALSKQTKLLNLKPVKKIHFSFDPFRNDAGVMRQTLNHFYQDRVRDTNPKCVFKSNILSNRSDPLIEVNLVDGKTILFRTQSLDALEILQKFNELVSSQVVVEETEVTGKKPVQTKSQKRR